MGACNIEKFWDEAILYARYKRDLGAGFHLGFSSRGGANAIIGELRGARTTFCIVIIQVFYTGFFISKGYYSAH